MKPVTIFVIIQPNYVSTRQFEYDIQIVDHTIHNPVFEIRRMIAFWNERVKLQGLLAGRQLG